MVAKTSLHGTSRSNWCGSPLHISSSGHAVLISPTTICIFPGNGKWTSVEPPIWIGGVAWLWKEWCISYPEENMRQAIYSLGADIATSIYLYLYLKQNSKELPTTIMNFSGYLRKDSRPIAELISLCLYG